MLELGDFDMESSSALPQELVEHIASYLPLWATPSSLLALALTNHSFYVVIRPMVYTKLILRNENDALNVIQRILADPDLGKSVRELHIMTELSKDVCNGKPPFDVVTGLEWAIKDELFPNVHTFGLHLMHGWRKDERDQTVFGYGQLAKSFWRTLRDKCPRLRGIIVSGLGDHPDDPWLKYSGIYDLAGFEELTNVGVVFQPEQHTLDGGPYKLLRSVPVLSSSLHTLRLGMNQNFESASLVLSHRFPYLKSLHLDSFSVPDRTEAMVFWRRHPTLETLRLPRTTTRSRWFLDDAEAEILPNLRHFQANFEDVRALSPILHRLVSLSVRQCNNAQTPYLLRSVLPNGLPNLRSLEIHQKSSLVPLDWHMEGARWYETADREFALLEGWKRRTILDDILSIAKGAPNLEELALHPDSKSYISQKELLANRQTLASFTKLERLYYHGPESELDDDRFKFYRNSGWLAESCKKLNLVTNFRSYMAAQIRRRDDGKFEESDVVPVMGYGMQIGYEDDAFPRIYI